MFISVGQIMLLFFFFAHALYYSVMVAEGVVMAIMHPGIAAGSATLAGIILFKSNMFSLEHHCSVVLY